MAQDSLARRPSAKRSDGSNPSTPAPATSPTTTPAKPGVQPLNLLTAKQATERLGISASTFERLIRKKALPLYRVGPGGPRRFRLDDVDRALIPEQHPEPSADISPINNNAQVEEA
jgi:excisionase family DNA binding protein